LILESNSSSFIIRRCYPINFPNVNENIHRTTAHHAFFAGFIRRQSEVMQSGLAFAHCLARFGPNFRFHAPAADRAGCLSIFRCGVEPRVCATVATTTRSLRAFASPINR
jgi:hypothetical protein